MRCKSKGSSTQDQKGCNAATTSEASRAGITIGCVGGPPLRGPRSKGHYVERRGKTPENHTSSVLIEWMLESPSSSAGADVGQPHIGKRHRREGKETQVSSHAHARGRSSSGELPPIHQIPLEHLLLLLRNPITILADIPRQGSLILYQHKIVVVGFSLPTVKSPQLTPLRDS